MGPQIVFYPLLWVANFQMLRTTDFEDMKINVKWEMDEFERVELSLLLGPRHTINFDTQYLYEKIT